MKSSIDEINTLITSADPYKRQIAIRGVMLVPELIDCLSPLVNDQDKYVRSSLIEAFLELAATKKDKSIEMLTQMQDDQDEEIKFLAQNSIEILRSPDEGSSEEEGLVIVTGNSLEYTTTKLLSNNQTSRISPEATLKKMIIQVIVFFSLIIVLAIVFFKWILS